MKLHKLSCPNCNGVLELNAHGKEYIFCPYCGQKFLVDDGKKEVTINQNIKKDVTITKNVTYTNRSIDDAEVLKAKNAARDSKIVVFIFSTFLIIGFGGLLLLWLVETININKAEAAGKIKAGFYGDYEGENYEAVVEQLKTLGFENISAVDLDDTGIAIWKSDKVESVSIGGDTNFKSTDYFDPDEPVIVRYH